MFFVVFCSSRSHFYFFFISFHFFLFLFISFHFFSFRSPSPSLLSRNSDPGSLIRLFFSPLTTTVRAYFFLSRNLVLKNIGIRTIFWGMNHRHPSRKRFSRKVLPLFFFFFFLSHTSNFPASGQAVVTVTGVVPSPPPVLAFNFYRA